MYKTPVVYSNHVDSSKMAYDLSEVEAAGNGAVF
jgi:hypothetical protein